MRRKASRQDSIARWTSDPSHRRPRALQAKGARAVDNRLTALQ
jgi:hypothetical protein